uniref:Uncharacterized protein n=1 Tax=Arundo donax TaxID=35708 RepID=A0A0A8ZAQ7_ARUDO
MPPIASATGRASGSAPPDRAHPSYGHHHHAAVVAPSSARCRTHQPKSFGITTFAFTTARFQFVWLQASQGH